MGESIKKIEVYEALYGLSSGVRKFLEAVDFLERAGVGTTALSQYRHLANEMCSGISTIVTELMAEVERRDFNELRGKNSTRRERETVDSDSPAAQV